MSAADESITGVGSGMDSYYGRPIVKEPVWKSEIPWYFFTGGIAGSSSALHGLARLTGNDELAKRSLYIGAVADAVSPLLLISDLGRPERFLNMLRVFKVTSPMSVGSWILFVSSGASNTAAALELLGILRPLKWLAEAASFVTGPPLATYTGALIANTAIPVWSEARDELPWLFGASGAASAGAAAAIVTPLGNAGPARRAAIGGVVAELGLMQYMEKKLGFVGEVYKQGEAGHYMKRLEGVHGGGSRAARVARKAQQGGRRGRRRARPRGRGGASLLGLQGGLPVGPRSPLHGRAPEGTPEAERSTAMSTNEARRVVTVERGSEWEDGFARPRVVLQPFAAPSVLGLYGFAAATFMVALHLTGVYGGVKTDGTLWPFAAVFGGVAQFMAGMWAYRVRDTLATAMHGAWGSFWIGFGILNLLIMTGHLPLVPPGSESDPAFSMWFYTLAAITAAGAFAALAESFGLFTVLALLATGSALLAVGLSLGSTGWVKLAGWVLVASAIAAWYMATAMMLLATAGKVVLPLGKPKKDANIPGSEPVKPIALEWAEPGRQEGPVMSSVPGKKPDLKLPPRVETARELLLEELGKLLTVEETLTLMVLPELVQELDDQELSTVVSQHLDETRGHVGRIKEAFLALGEVPAGKPAAGLDGLRSERERKVQDIDPALRGGFNCAAAMGTEHYEINAYEAAIRLADATGAGEVSHLLRANLEQEVAALGKLGKQADRLAARAG